jgi:arylformamidase
MGHSAGAHLAALVGSDGRYLAKEELKLSDLSGVILLDGAGYDIPRQIEQTSLPRAKTMYTTVFTADEAKQKEASPITHVAKGKGIPPFLILHPRRARRGSASSLKSLRHQRTPARRRAVGACFLRRRRSCRT